MNRVLNRTMFINRLFLISFVFLYRVSLDFAYRNIICVRFQYDGFHYSSTVTSIIISYYILLMSLLPLFKVFDNRNNYLSNEILLVLYLLSFVPFTTMLGCSLLSNDFILANCLFWLFLFIFTLVPIRFKSQSISITGKKLIGESHLKIIAVFFAIIILYISAVYTHFRFHFGLSDVYELRAEARSYNFPTILSYAYSWTRMINSILIAYFLRKREWAWAITCIIIQLLNFGVDGSKTTLFLMLFAILVSVIPSFNLQALNKWILISFVILIISCILAYYLFDNIVLISLFARRLLFVPVDISTKYYDFFTNNVPDYYRQSFLRLFGFTSPYDSISYMIGRLYYNQVTSANNGLISDVIANMGLPGIVFGPMLYAFVFKMLDIVTHRLDSRLVITVAMYAAITLVNTFLFRVLLTHGLIITFVLLYYIDTDTDTKEHHRRKRIQ